VSLPYCGTAATKPVEKKRSSCSYGVVVNFGPITKEERDGSFSTALRRRRHGLSVRF
jgi:hypothetical protein